MRENGKLHSLEEEVVFGEGCQRTIKKIKSPEFIGLRSGAGGRQKCASWVWIFLEVEYVRVWVYFRNLTFPILLLPMKMSVLKDANKYVIMS